MTGAAREECPICGAAPSTDATFVKEPWRIVTCAECSHGWTVPSPSDLELQSCYESSHYYSQRGMVHSESAQGPRAAALRAQFSGSRLLDIGCGLGSLLAAAREIGFHVVGSELSEHAAHIARTTRGLDVRVGPFSTAQFEEDERFDLITLIHVLEHVRDPRADLIAAHSLLAPRGRLFVEVPNPAAWAATYSTRWKEKIYDLPLHLNHFSVDSLETVLRQAGFADVTVIVSLPDNIDRVLGLGSRIRSLARPHSPPPPASADPGREEMDRIPPGSSDPTSGRPSFGARLTALARRRFQGWKLIAIGARNS